MLGSGVLDVAIGLAFVFLLVSVVCTAVREALETILKHRAAYLEYAIRELMNDREGNGLVTSLYNHPLIHGLFSGAYTPGKSKEPTVFSLGRKLPSYIPTKSFSNALLSIIVRGGDVTKPPPQIEKISLRALRESVSKLENNPYIQHALVTALDEGANDLEAVRRALETWFDSAMDRVSGWYKRSTQIIIFTIACVVVGALNVNAITIANTLYRDQNLREATVAAASSARADIKADDAVSTLKDLQLPIGWHAPQPSDDHATAKPSKPDTSGDLITSILGLLLTAFAATLGAPFWFDILNKIMVIRGTVKPHEKSPEEGSEDRQAVRALPLTVAAPVLTANDGVVQMSRLSAAADNDVDDCNLGDDDPTPDAALPPSTGGVGAAH